MQLAPAFVAFAPPAIDGAPPATVIHLDPADLGRVQVRIDQAPDGTARVALAVERPDTLMTLQHDRPQLDAALDQAGIPAQGRTVEFSLAPPSSGATADRFGTPGSGGQSGQQPGSQTGGSFGQNTRDDPQSRRPPARLAWMRAGIDITA